MCGMPRRAHNMKKGEMKTEQKNSNFVNNSNVSALVDIDNTNQSD